MPLKEEGERGKNIRARGGKRRKGEERKKLISSVSFCQMRKKKEKKVC